MKKLIYPAILVFGIGLFSSCAKKNDTPPNTTPTNSMNASVAGKGWSASTLNNSANSVTITVTGTASDGSYMKFTMPPAVKAGADSLSQTGAYTFQYNNNVTSYIVKSGTLKISSYANKVMVATFSATLSDPSTSNLRFVSGGSFTAIFP